MSKLKKIAAIFLLFNFLLHTVSASVHFHFCSGELQSVAISQPAPSCHQLKNQQLHKCHQASDNQKEADCCQDKVIEAYDGDSILKDNLLLPFISEYYFLTPERELDLLVNPLYTSIESPFDYQIISFKISRDYCALFQTFLC